MKKVKENKCFGIISLLVKIPIRELENIVFYSFKVLKEGYYDSSVEEIIKTIEKNPIYERANIFYLSTELIKFSEKTNYHCNRIHIVKYLAEIEDVLQREI